MRVERQRTPFLPVRVHELCNESAFFFYLPYEWKYCNKFQIFLKFYFSNVYFCKCHLPGPLRLDPLFQSTDGNLNLFYFTL